MMIVVDAGAEKSEQQVPFDMGGSDVKTTRQILAIFGTAFYGVKNGKWDLHRRD
jgi:hypothetical protein